MLGDPITAKSSNGPGMRAGTVFLADAHHSGIATAPYGAHRARSTVLAMVIFQPRDRSLRPSPAAQRPRQAPCSPPPKNAPPWGDVSTTSTNSRVQVNEREEQIKVKNSESDPQEPQQITGV
jgi:hypothetical protein